MKNYFELGTFGGMRVTCKYFVLNVSLVLVVVISVAAILLFGVAPAWALVGSIAFVLHHHFLEIWHQYGHYRAGKALGYPLRYVSMVHVLAASIYPKDEPELPREIHIQRALGGPRWSFLFSLGMGLAGVLLYVVGVTPLANVLLFVSVYNFGFFVVGAFVPLDFIGIETDGSTLLRYRR